MMIYVCFGGRDRVCSGGVEGENICIYVCVCVCVGVFRRKGPGVFRRRRRGEHMYICLCIFGGRDRTEPEA